MKTLLIILFCVTLNAQVLVDSTMSADSVYLKKMKESVVKMKRLKTTGLQGAKHTRERSYLTLEKISFYALSIISSGLDGYTDGLNYRKHAFNDLDANKTWHRLKGVDIGAKYALGFAIAIDFVNSDYDYSVPFRDLLVHSAIFWNVHDETWWQGAHGHWNPRPGCASDWARKGNNGIQSELWASPYAKLGFLAFAILLDYFWEDIF